MHDFCSLILNVMKATMILLTTIIQLMPINYSIVDDISSALRNGQTSTITKYFANSVDVTILEDQSFVDKRSASSKVNNFFSDKKISGYKIIHKGKSKGKDSVYTIGNLNTDKGKYQIYIFISGHNGTYQIEEIKIEN